MQLELSLGNDVRSDSDAHSRKLLDIHPLRFVYPDTKNYFGIEGTNPFDSPLEKKKILSGQQGLFGDEPPRIKMTVSDFILAYKCPKLFNTYWLRKSLPRPPHHPVFEVGTKVDSAAKKYLGLPFGAR